MSATNLDDPCIDEYVVRIAFVEGEPAGTSVTVSNGDIVVPLTAVEDGNLRYWLEGVVRAHPDVF